MKIWLLESYFGGSHKQWAEGLKLNSQHQIEIFSLSAKHWKWRMHGSAIYFAELVNQRSEVPDLYLVTDLMDVALFKGLLNSDKLRPLVLYFHENQFAYPKSKLDTDVDTKRDQHYGFINYSSALAATSVAFNSKYNYSSFFKGITSLLKVMPKPRLLSTIDLIKLKATVVPVGINKIGIPDNKPNNKVKTILWNHRWEEEKNAEDFFKALLVLKQDGVKFRLIVCGKSSLAKSNLFDGCKAFFQDEILFWGFAENRKEYAKLLQLSDILPVTSNQEFFGISLMEAISAGVTPLLPNRLVYPEHFSKSEFSEIGYEDLENFVFKLKSFCEKDNLLKFSHISDSYNWNVLSTTYDQLFEKTV